MSDEHMPQPLGPEIRDWRPPARPGPPEIGARHVRLQRLDPDRHAAAIFAATAGQDRVWDYMNSGPFADLAALRDWMEAACASDQVFYAFVDPATDAAFGHAAFMRIDAGNGVLEIGNVVIAPGAQRSRAASEGLMTMIGWAFCAGYRRVEWKCNALNAPSRRAARRYGFAFEGVFRRHMIVRGRNRDTAWFAMTEDDWRKLAGAYSDWLDPANFDADGRQRRALSALTDPVVRRAEAELAGL